MPDAAEALPPESADAAPDGVRLAELAESLPLSRASVFEVVKALGITTSKGPGPGGRGRVAWVTAAEADRITAAAMAVDRGEVRIADLSRPTRQTAATLTALEACLEAVKAEVERAQRLHPAWPSDPLHALAILGEEFGELTRAMVQLTYETEKVSSPSGVAEEALQTAAMAIRLLLHLNDYRYIQQLSGKRPT
jgi:hypothetical protein